MHPDDSLSWLEAFRELSESSQGCSEPTNNHHRVRRTGCCRCCFCCAASGDIQQQTSSRRFGLKVFCHSHDYWHCSISMKSLKLCMNTFYFEIEILQNSCLSIKAYLQLLNILILLMFDIFSIYLQHRPLERWRMELLLTDSG